MNVNFDGLRKGLCNSYESIVELVKKSYIKPDGLIEIDVHELEDKLTSLHNNVVSLLAIVNEETGASLLDDENFKVAHFEVPFNNGW